MESRRRQIKLAVAIEFECAKRGEQWRSRQPVRSSGWLAAGVKQVESAGGCRYSRDWEDDEPGHKAAAAQATMDFEVGAGSDADYECTTAWMVL